MIDSHAHLDDEKFSDDIDVIIAQAIEAGITGIVNPGCDEKSSLKAVSLAEQYGIIYAGVGFHPHDAKKYDYSRHTAFLLNLTKKDKVVAIGEIGLDYYYDNSPRDIQKQVFIEQLQLAGKAGLPVIIHNRDAHQDTHLILSEHFDADCGGVMHSYSGSVEMAKQFMDLGLYISISGPITFKNARKNREVVKSVPLNRMLIETDSPYLTPVPHRGERNSPAYVIHVAEKIAELKEISTEEVIRVTEENTRKLFKI
jgi:TatD DNase family protein